MKREFLKGLELEKEVIDKIMEENGNDIEHAKEVVRNELQPQIDELTGQLQERDKQLDGLKGVDAEALKAEIERLQNENSETKASYEEKIKEININNAVREAIRDAEAKDVETIVKLLDMSDVDFDKKGNLTGISEQLETLKTGELTKVFFGANAPVPPSGTNPAEGSTPPNPQKKPSEMSYSELCDFMEANPGVDINSLG